MIYELFVTHWNRIFLFQPIREIYGSRTKITSIKFYNIISNAYERAEHCDAASKAHKEAAKQHESDDAKQAGNNAALAHAHTLHTNDQSEMVIKNMAHPVTSSKK